MTDTYKGESEGKKWARLAYWLEVRAFMGDRFRSMTHIVLASREGGDLSVLEGFDMPVDNILAVERDSEACEAARAKFPSHRIVHGDVADVVRRFARRGRVGHVFLDFCSPICPELFETVFSVIQFGLTDGALIGIGMMRGREKTSSGFQSQDQKQAAAWRANIREDPHVSADTSGRDLVLMQQIAARVWRLKQKWLPIHVGEVLYHSRTPRTRGVPMIILLWRLYRENTGVHAKAFARRAIACAEAIGREHDFVIRPADHDARLSAIDLDAGHFGVAVSPTAADKDRTFGGAPLPPGRAHLLLNIPRRTLVAWKAHQSRGSYRTVA